MCLHIIRRNSNYVTTLFYPQNYKLCTKDLFIYLFDKYRIWEYLSGNKFLAVNGLGIITFYVSQIWGILLQCFNNIIIIQQKIVYLLQRATHCIHYTWKVYFWVDLHSIALWMLFRFFSDICKTYSLHATHPFSMFLSGTGPEFLILSWSHFGG